MKRPVIRPHVYIRHYQLINQIFTSKWTDTLSHGAASVYLFEGMTLQMYCGMAVVRWNLLPPADGMGRDSIHLCSTLPTNRCSSCHTILGGDGVFARRPLSPLQCFGSEIQY